MTAPASPNRALAAVKRTAGKRETCQAKCDAVEIEYRAAIVAARAAGATFSAIGAAAGISKQRAQQIANEG